MRATLRPGEMLLLGTDLVKSPDVLVPAYDDAAGVTAEFNKNVLHVINRELKADFDPDAFEHVAIWDADDEWIEMRLRSLHAQRVRVELLGLDVAFDGASRCAPRSRRSSGARALRPNWPRPGSSSRTGGPIRKGGSGCRCPRHPDLGPRSPRSPAVYACARRS